MQRDVYWQVCTIISVSTTAWIASVNKVGNLLS